MNVVLWFLINLIYVKTFNLVKDNSIENFIKPHTSALLHFKDKPKYFGYTLQWKPTG